jgi:hypothetical protein
MSVSDALDTAGYASRGETALATDIIVTPVDPSTLILDAGLTGQEPRIQNVTQTQLLAWPVIGRGHTASRRQRRHHRQRNRRSAYLACLDIFAGAAATLRLAVSYDNHRTGTEPARGTYRDITFDSIDFTSDWQPPRWRFLYDTRRARLLILRLRIRTLRYGDDFAETYLAIDATIYGLVLILPRNTMVGPAWHVIAQLTDSDTGLGVALLEHEVAEWRAGVRGVEGVWVAVPSHIWDFVRERLPELPPHRLPGERPPGENP